jgi:hypothetical protein
MMLDKWKISLKLGARSAPIAGPSIGRRISTSGDDARAVAHSLRDSRAYDGPERPIAIEIRDQYRGNRIVSNFYPEHWARVQVARSTAVRYGGIR